jgi:hypothetical protein
VVKCHWIIIHIAKWSSCIGIKTQGSINNNKSSQNSIPQEKLVAEIRSYKIEKHANLEESIGDVIHK